MLLIDKWGSGKIICSWEQNTGQNALTEVNAIKISISCSWAEVHEAKGKGGNKNEGEEGVPFL